MIITILPVGGGSPAFAEMSMLPPPGSTVIVRRTYFGRREFEIVGHPTFRCNEDEEVSIEVEGRELES